MERSPLLVIDASVAVKWFVVEPHREKALRIREGYARGVIELLAPSLIQYEVGNAIRFHPGSAPEHVAEAVQSILGMQMGGGEVSAASAEAASRIAFEEEITMYDAFYLALAERSRARLVTDDRRLYRKVRKRRSMMQLLEDYQAPRL